MIFLIGCPADGNVLVSLDDTSVWQDEGVPYVGWALVNSVDFGKTNPYGRMRRIAQAVTVGGEADIAITPYADGSEYDEQTVDVTLNVIDGETQIVTAEPAVEGRRFQFRMQAEHFTGRVEFGSADMDMIEHRT